MKERVRITLEFEVKNARKTGIRIADRAYKAMRKEGVKGGFVTAALVTQEEEVEQVPPQPRVMEIKRHRKQDLKDSYLVGSVIAKFIKKVARELNRNENVQSDLQRNSVGGGSTNSSNGRTKDRELVVEHTSN